MTSNAEVKDIYDVKIGDCNSFEIINIKDLKLLAPDIMDHIIKRLTAYVSSIGNLKIRYIEGTRHSERLYTLSLADGTPLFDCSYEVKTSSVTYSTCPGHWVAVTEECLSDDAKVCICSLLKEAYANYVSPKIIQRNNERRILTEYKEVDHQREVEKKRQEIDKLLGVR